MFSLATIYRLTHPVLRLWWFVRRPHHYASAAVVERKGEILFVRNTYGRREEWKLPAGYRRPSEDAGAAAVRETMEETGLVLHKVKHLTTEHFREYHRKLTLTVFHGVGVGALRIDPAEIAEAAWYPIDHLPEPMGEGTRRAIAALLKAKASQR